MSEEYQRLVRRLEALEAHYDTGWIARSDWTEVHLGSSTTKNVDSDVTHNLGAPLSQLLVKVLVSSDGTDANSHELGGNYSYPASYGLGIMGVSDNSIRVQVADTGIYYIGDDGTYLLVDTEDWFYKVTVKRLW